MYSQKHIQAVLKGSNGHPEPTTMLMLSVRGLTDPKNSFNTVSIALETIEMELTNMLLDIHTKYVPPNYALGNISWGLYIGAYVKSRI